MGYSLNSLTNIFSPGYFETAYSPLLVAGLICFPPLLSAADREKADKFCTKKKVNVHLQDCYN